ncbi:SH3 domain-containing protein [bacterium]|nr:SH3 domain-containing protein [bacterium]
MKNILFCAFMFLFHFELVDAIENKFNTSEENSKNSEAHCDMNESNRHCSLEEKSNSHVAIWGTRTKGFIKNIQDSKYIVLSSKSFLNAKDSPSKEAFSAGIITKGKKYKIYKTEGDWFKVKTDGGAWGWVQNRYVEVIEETQQIALNSQNKGKIKIITPFANIKEEPASDAFSIGTLEKGQELAVLEERNGWLKITHKGIEGWVPGRVTEHLSVPTPQTTRLVTAEQQRIAIITPFANIKEEPSADSFAMGTLDKGQELAVLEERNGWYKIKHNGVEGWIPGGSVDSQKANDARQTAIETPAQFAVTQSTGKSNIMGYAKWVCWGGGILSSALAMNFYKQGNSTYQDYENASTQTDALRLYDDTLAFDKKRNTMFIAAGVTTGLGILFHILYKGVPNTQRRFSMGTTSGEGGNILLGLNVNF